MAVQWCASFNISARALAEDMQNKMPSQQNQRTINHARPITVYRKYSSTADVRKQERKRGRENSFLMNRNDCEGPTDVLSFLHLVYIVKLATLEAQSAQNWFIVLISLTRAPTYVRESGGSEGRGCPRSGLTGSSSVHLPAALYYAVSSLN